MFFRGLTVEEVMLLLEEQSDTNLEDDEVVDVYVEPPNESDLSGADSADEDDGGIIANISRAQLFSNCQIVNRRRHKKGQDTPDYDSDQENPNLEHFGDERLDSTFSDFDINLFDASASHGQASASTSFEPPLKRCRVSTGDGVNDPAEPPYRIPKRMPGPKTMFQWKSNDVTPIVSSIFPEGNYTDVAALSPVELFELNFDNEMYEFIVTESNKYQTKQDPENSHKVSPLTVGDIKAYMGILITSGLCPIPSTRLYWSSSRPFYNKQIASTMSRDRFEQIHKMIHFASPNQFNSADRMWKLRPFTDRLIERFMRNFHPEENLSYDESMIPYYGRHGCKQYIKGKPIRFGYKVWSLNTTSGYLINFEIYQGSNPRIPKEYGVVGLNASPLLMLVDQLPVEKRELPYHFYFDNLFTGMPLLYYLHFYGYNGTGTIRDNRIPSSSPIPKKKATMSKYNKGVLSRGHTESAQTSFGKTPIYVTQWVDNAVCSVASTKYGKNPLDLASRYSRKEQKKISIQRPYAIHQYNTNMGGTDRMDQNVACYRITVRQQKWWWSIFTWAIDVTIQNCWLLKRKATGNFKLGQLEFREEISKHYCEKYSIKKYFKAPDKLTKIGQTAMQYDTSVPHYPGPIPITETNKGGKLSCASCKSKQRIRCITCKVGLCVKCFEGYHTK